MSPVLLMHTVVAYLHFYYMDKFDLRSTRLRIDEAIYILAINGGAQGRWERLHWSTFCSASGDFPLGNVWRNGVFSE
ncbi:unnamed protein product [Arctogadus glacialis]